MNSEETFVLASLKEFVKLWGSGSQATFNLECSNGQAWFHLGARLGPPASAHFFPPNPPPQVPKKRKKTPARIGKDLARAAEHRAKKDNSAVPAQASSPSSPAAAVGISFASPTPPAVSASSTPPPTSASTNLISVKPADSEGTQPVSTVGLSDASADLSIVAVTGVEENHESSHQAFEQVHATAVIENCPEEICDYKEIYDLVTKEHHMRANIANVNIDHQSTRKFRSNIFTHTLNLVLTVKAAALCDSPRQYIWKHLGQNDLKKKNGTAIKFVRIHVK